jgi:hypothetical protein
MPDSPPVEINPLDVIASANPIRLTWLTPILIDWHPLRPELRFLTPIGWPALLWLICSIPLFFGEMGGHPWFLRPFWVCFIGMACELILAYLMLLLYRHMFSDIKLALQPTEYKKAALIMSRTLDILNADRKLLLLIFGTTFVACSACFLGLFEVLPKKFFAFLYVLDQVWYNGLRDDWLFRCASLALLVFFTCSVFVTGFWFQIHHWRMFEKLLRLKLTDSPILLYHGFSKMWLTTNVSSLALLSSNLFLWWFLNFQATKLQIFIGFAITVSGVISLLWPTYTLYRHLMIAKENRTWQLLLEIKKQYDEEKSALLEYASLYSDIYVERGVGNIQALISVSIGLLSLLIALVQVYGIDAAFRQWLNVQ